jgi:hypothetical protein
MDAIRYAFSVKKKTPRLSFLEPESNDEDDD